MDCCRFPFDRRASFVFMDYLFIYFVLCTYALLGFIIELGIGIIDLRYL